VFTVLLLALSLLGLAGPLRAQEKPPVQQLTGYLELNEDVFYVLHDLKTERGYKKERTQGILSTQV